MHKNYVYFFIIMISIIIRIIFNSLSLSSAPSTSWHHLILLLLLFKMMNIKMGNETVLVSICFRRSYVVIVAVTI